MASIVWRAGTEVEVAGDASEGFANSWFRATLLSSVNTRTGMVPVELTHFYGADGVTPEQEHVALKRLRPPAPGQLEGANKPVGKVYALHSAVEVLADEVWWLGRVSKVSVDGKALDVQHKAGDTTANVRLHERIRRAHTWHESSHTWREADGAEEEEEDEAEEEEEEQKPPRRASGRTAPEEPVRRTRGARVNYGGAEASEEERPEQRPQRLTRTATGSRPKAPTFQPELRRSGRARVSRLVTVNGHAVLRSNLGAGDVDVMEGEYAEASDEEEGDEDEAGNDTEEEESESSDFLRSPEDHRPAAKKARKEAQHSTRTWGAREASRLAHNRAMDEAADALEPAREAFLASHLPLLAPFLEARVVARLQRRDASLGVPEREVPTPPQIIASLRPHQLVGLRYLANAYERGLHPILGDEMGLGKTLQAICLLAHACFALDSGPHLVVCPLSVLPTWQAELQRWCPALRVVRAHSSDVGERERLRDGPLRDPQAFDVVVTTYEMLTSDNFSSTLCSRIHWGCLVLDEGHRVKNEGSGVARAVRSVHRRCTVLLTGTLLQNNLHELWSLLNLQYPDTFTDARPFDAAFDLCSQRHTVDSAALASARNMLRPLWLRREKKDVELALPPKTETLVHCPLSAAQTALYRAALLRNAEALDGCGASVGAIKKMNHLCMQLRLLCGHPLLITEESEFEALGLAEEEAPVEALIAASGKLGVLDRLLQRLRGSGNRVVIFSQFTMVLDVLEEYAEKRGHPFVRLDGSVSRARRAVDIMLFNRKDSPLFLFLASTRAGGLGINLQTADTCILYDSDWNPQPDEQAMARVHRIGQTRPVSIFRLVTANSVEERIMARAQKKLFLDAMVSRTCAEEEEEEVGEDAGEDSDDLQACAPRNAQTLASDLRFGVDQLFRSAAGAEPSEEELDALCDRSAGGDARRARLSGLQTAAAMTDEVLAQAPPPLASYLGPQGPEMRRQALEAARAAQAAAEMAVGARVRASTTVQVDGFTVKRSNLYDLEGGEPSVWQSEARGGEAARARTGAAPKRRSQVAGRDYMHSAWCQVCWEGGELFCCTFCPASYHSTCLGVSAKSLRAQVNWACPHHACAECARKAPAVGGLLFRCESCEYAYCEDHLPEEVLDRGRIVDECARFLRLGQEHPSQACFIHCSAECEDFAGTGFEGALEDNGEEEAPPWVAEGDEQLLVPPKAGQPGGVALRGATFSELKGYLESVYHPKAPVPGADGGACLDDWKARDGGDDAFAALYTAARAAVLRGAPNRNPPKPPPKPKLMPPPKPVPPVGVGLTAAGMASATAAPPPATTNASTARRVTVRWTAEEIAALHKLVAQHGVGKWKAVMGAGQLNPCRTTIDISNKWASLRRTAKATEKAPNTVTPAAPEQEQEPVAADDDELIELDE